MDAEERRFGDVEMPARDHLLKITVKEREEQCADVRAVNIRIRHDDDPVVAKSADVKLFADGGAHGDDQ